MKGSAWSKGMILKIREYNDQDLIKLYEEKTEEMTNNKCAYGQMFLQSRMPFIKHEMKKRRLTH